MIYSIIAILLVSFCFGGISSLALSLFGLLLGYVFCIVYVPSYQKKEAIKVFNVVFAIYLIFTFLRCLDIYLYPQNFLNGKDEILYWKESKNGAFYHTKDLLNELFSDVYYEEQLYYFFLKCLSSVATQYFDGNTECLQLLGTSIAGSYVSIFLFAILKYFKITQAAKKTIIYMIFVCILPVSLIIHRDCLVAFFYAFSLYYILCCNNRTKTITILILCSFVTFFIREQSGLFIIALLFTYLYNNCKNKWLIIFLFSLVLLLFLPFLVFVFNNLNDTFVFYTQYAEDNASNGLSRYIDNLPIGIKQIALIIQGQFNPLPIWAKWPDSPTFYTMLMGILWCIISVYWFRVFSFAVYFSTKYKSMIPKDVLVLWMVFILFLILNSSNADPRRMVCMYPICYLIYCYVDEFILKENEKKKMLYCYSVSVVVLMLLIIVLKITH